MLLQILNASSDYLLPTMATLLGFALVARFLAYRSSKRDYSYYSSFTEELDKKIEADVDKHIPSGSRKEYIEETISSIYAEMSKGRIGEPPRSTSTFKRGEEISFDDYQKDKNSIIFGIESEVMLFKGSHPPHFEEVASRIMAKDSKWTKLYGTIRIDVLARFIDALPNIFIIMGIFGTFLGIFNALPQIAQIDFSNFDSSSGVLTDFVLDISFAMKTSIAGILCSLVLHMVNTFFPITQMREGITRKLESTLEVFWHFLNSESDHEHRQEEILMKISQTLNRIENLLESDRKSKVKKAS